MSGLFKPDRLEQIACVKREIAMRRRVYPRWVSTGRMKREAAEREIETMEEVLVTLEKLP